MQTSDGCRGGKRRSLTPQPPPPWQRQCSIPAFVPHYIIELEPLYKENWTYQNLQRTPQILPVDDVLPSLQILTLLMDNLMTPSLISLSILPNLLWHHEKDNLDTQPIYLIQAKSPHQQYLHLLHSHVPHPQTASGTNSQVYLPLTHPHHKPSHLTTRTHQMR